MNQKYELEEKKNCILQFLVSAAKKILDDKITSCAFLRRFGMSVPCEETMRINIMLIVTITPMIQSKALRMAFVVFVSLFRLIRKKLLQNSMM